MTFTRLVALALSVACAAGTVPFVPPALVAASGGEYSAIQQTITPTSGLVISGTVVREDRTTTVAGVRLRLRNVDKGTIVGQAISDQNGAFSFAVTAPGLYVVEAVKDNGGVRAVSDPVPVTNSPLTTLVILPELEGAAAFFTSAAFLAMATATAAGITGWALSENRTASPER
jgi:hypothetical protein